MKIIIKNQDGNPVFTFDVETGKAEAHVPVNDCAAEFLRGIETVIAMVTSQFMSGVPIRDVLLEAGKGEGSGDFTIRMGSTGSNGDVNIMNPRLMLMRKCTDCKDGTQTLFYTTGPCKTCHGTMLVPDH